VVDIDSWAGNAFPLTDWSDDVDQGVDNARLAADKLTSITIIRAGVAQDAQSVRIEPMRRETTAAGESGLTGTVDALVIGYKGHPLIADTDIQRGDRFAVGGVSYEVIMVVPGLPDSLQAYVKVRG
jgi:hypothetical protein